MRRHNLSVLINMSKWLLHYISHSTELTYTLVISHKTQRLMSGCLCQSDSQCAVLDLVFVWVGFMLFSTCLSTIKHKIRMVTWMRLNLLELAGGLPAPSWIYRQLVHSLIRSTTICCLDITTRGSRWATRTQLLTYGSKLPSPSITLSSVWPLIVTFFVKDPRRIRSRFSPQSSFPQSWWDCCAGMVASSLCGGFWRPFPNAPERPPSCFSYTKILDKNVFWPDNDTRWTVRGSPHYYSSFLGGHRCLCQISWQAIHNCLNISVQGFKGSFIHHHTTQGCITKCKLCSLHAANKKTKTKNFIMVKCGGWIEKSHSPRKEAAL